jgi:hypothetical protein
LTGVSSLRQFVRSRDSGECCDSCGVSLAVGHDHQFEPSARRVRCVCVRCAGQAGAWRAIPRTVRSLPAFQMTDAQWDELTIPISLAFFSYCSPAGRVVAFYPGPAGAAESTMGLESWSEILEANPEIDAMQPDVEALLVNRVGATREYFLVPIDECYRLVGLIRSQWRGLSGGSLVWGEITAFFDVLRAKAAFPAREPACRV